MTALTVVPGRRGVPTTVTLRQTELDDLTDELSALTLEGVNLAARIVGLARRAQVQLARGASPADALHELEVLGLRHGVRMTAAAAALQADGVCPDVAGRELGHGAAA